MKKLTALFALALMAACDGAGFYTSPIQGPRTKDADLFAKAFLDQMQARSFEANREFCGVFGRDKDGYVIATAPIEGQLDACRTPVMDEDFQVFASYHSHGGYDPEADSEVPSSYDLVADKAEGVVGYISTPGGRIWYSKNGAAVQLCGRGCITVDPRFEPRDYGPVKHRYTIRDLRRRERG